jgi:branched-chain amino acid transport system substrate-binding protein
MSMFNTHTAKVLIRTNAAIAMAMAMALATTLALSNEVHAADYKVGILLPFSGVYAGLGNHIENGFALGLEHYASDLGADSVTTIKADTEANPGSSLAKTKKMILRDKADVLVGLVSSAVLGAVRNFVHQSGVPLVVANAGNINATGKDCSANIIRVSFSNAQITRPMGSWMAKQGIKKVYLMAPDYAAGHQMMEAFRTTFTAGGGEIIGEAYPPLKGTKDYGPYLTAAKATKPDAIFTFFAGGAAIAFVKQYAQFGINKDIPLFGAGFLTSAAYVHVQGQAADGVTGSLHYFPGLDTKENRAFQAAYQAKHGGKTGSEFAVAGYDAARLVAEAIKAAAGDKTKFKSELSNVHFTGPRGPLKIDPKTHNVIQNIYVFKNEFVAGKVQQRVLATIPNVQDGPNGCVM